MVFIVFENKTIIVCDSSFGEIRVQAQHGEKMRVSCDLHYYLQENVVMSAKDEGLIEYISNHKKVVSWESK